MINLSFRKKMTEQEIIVMQRWVSANRTDHVVSGLWDCHPDNSRTFFYKFASERDAAIFKLRFV